MTLVEIIISMGILVIIISFCYLNLNISKYQTVSFAKQICSDIRYVRTKNMGGNFNTYIHYEKRNGTTYYVLIKDSERIKEVALPINSSILKSLEKISFRQDGSLSSGKGETIQIKYNKETIEITIVPFSGRVLLKEGIYG